MPYLRSPFENGMLTLWVRIGSVRTLALVHMSHPEAEWRRHADYLVRYLTPISVDYLYLKNYANSSAAVSDFLCVSFIGIPGFLCF